ncbi:chemerin-like receptor 1 isoform X2 [Lissotriton helveticus]
MKNISLVIETMMSTNGNIITIMDTATSSMETVVALFTKNITSATEDAISLLPFSTFSTIASTSAKTSRGLPPSRKCDDDDKNIIERMNTLSVVLYSVAFLLGVIGNGLVIWVTGLKMKKTVNTVWFLNLALADFIFTIFLPLSIAYTAMDFHWPFGKFLCKMNAGVSFLNVYASVFFLTIISIDRCFSVVLPVWCQNHRTIRLASIIALVTWLLAFAISSPILYFRDTRISRKTNTTACFPNYGNLRYLFEKRQKAIAITRFMFGFLIPFIVIVICYGIISWRIIRNRMSSRSRKPFLIMTAVIVCFFLCWLPFHIFAFIELSIHKGTNCALERALKVGIPVATNLAFLNSCINPILYVLLGLEARSTIRKSFLKKLESAFKEDASQDTRYSRNQSKTMSEADMSVDRVTSKKFPMNQVSVTVPLNN